MFLLLCGYTSHISKDCFFKSSSSNNPFFCSLVFSNSVFSLLVFSSCRFSVVWFSDLRISNLRVSSVSVVSFTMYSHPSYRPLSIRLRSFTMYPAFSSSMNALLKASLPSVKFLTSSNLLICQSSGNVIRYAQIPFARALRFLFFNTSLQIIVKLFAFFLLTIIQLPHNLFCLLKSPN